MTACAARSGALMRSSRVDTISTSPAETRDRWIRPESYVCRPSASAATVVTDPARPTAVRALPTGTTLAQPHDRLVDVGGGCCHLSARRRVVVQVPLGEPDRADVDRQRRLDSRRAEDQLGGPPADVDDEERAVRGSRSRVAPSKDSAASSSPLITSGSRASTSRTISVNASRLPASRVALVATMRTASTPSALQVAA
jgi:hypothetical protein